MSQHGIDTIANFLLDPQKLRIQINKLHIFPLIIQDSESEKAINSRKNFKANTPIQSKKQA
jgi:hypothetical protein